MRTRIKFCGITRPADAELAASLGVDALGFVFVPASPRYLDASAAAAIVSGLPPLLSVVALFKDASAEQIQQVIDTLRPQVLQFHGAEDAAFCLQWKLPYWKSVSMQQPANFAAVQAAHPQAQALLLDSHGADGMGGTGQVFDWTSIPKSSSQSLILAGGLRPENVAQAVRIARPSAVDVSSGIEASPGVKDAARMRAFVEAVRQADHPL